MIQKMHNFDRKPFTTRVTIAKQKKGTGTLHNSEIIRISESSVKKKNRSIIEAEKEETRLYKHCLVPYFVCVFQVVEFNPYAERIHTKGKP